MPSRWGSDEPDGWKGEAWINGIGAVVGAIALPCIVFLGLDVEASSSALSESPFWAP